MKRLNNIVGMSGVRSRTTMEGQHPKDLRRGISFMPSTDLNDEWIQIVVKVRKVEESFLVEERLLREHQDKPEERKRNPEKGKKKATISSSREGGAFN
jgi:hypothetical protein